MAAKEIALDHGDALTDDSVEIARIWITNNAGSSVWINAGVLEDPTVFGYLMSDTVRHAARAYAARWSVDECQALQAIVNGLNEELKRQAGELTTIRLGGLN